MITYSPDPDWGVGEGLGALSHLTTDRLLDLSRVAGVLRIGGPAQTSRARCGRMATGLLSKIPRLPEHVVRNIVDRYGGLQQILRASAEDLDSVEGIEVAGAHFVKEGLARLAETSILDRFG